MSVEEGAGGRAIDPDVWRLQSIARDVVTDYAEMVCDDLATCACSMAQMNRLLSSGSVSVSCATL